jgi:DNA-binding response OmpR family regulator
VQDDDPAREKLREALEEQGFMTVRAVTLAEVSHIAELGPFAAVVDLRAGEEPQSAVIRVLRTRSPDLPVIVAAPRGETAQTEVPLRLLARPFSPAQLLDAVEQIYESRCPQRHLIPRGS